jgi:glutamyl-tRNA synthetase
MVNISRFQILQFSDWNCIFVSKFIKIEGSCAFCTQSNRTLHIGGVRTALFNYLFAKKNNGVFFYGLKIPTKIGLFQVPKLISSIRMVGYSSWWNNRKNEKFGPYRQSERKPLYKDYADQLINTGWAYYFWFSH